MFDGSATISHDKISTRPDFVKDEQVRQLYMQALISNTVIIAISVLYYFLLRSRLHPELLFLWMFFLLIFAFFRLYLWLSHRRKPQRRPAQTWLNMYSIGCGLIGISWSLIYPFLLISDDPIVLASLLLLAFGVMSSAIPILSVYFPAFIAYTYPQGLALVSVLLSMDNPVYSWLSMAVALYLVMITLFTRNTNSSILQSINLMLENESLIENLNKEIGQRENLIAQRTSELEKKNEDLTAEIKSRNIAEEESRVSEKKFRAIFENSPMGLVHFDEHGIITECNDKFLDIMGSSRRKTIHLNTFATLNDSRMLSAIEAALSGKIGHFEGEYLSVTGKKRSHIEANFGPILATNNTISGAIGVFEDVSEKRRIEKENQELEAQLQQAQKMKAIGTMASGVAHDLNNILSGIVTYPQLIRLDLPEDSPINKHLEAMEKSGKRAALVVNDLLTIARDAATVKEPININVLIEEIIESPEWQSIISPHPDLMVKAALDAEFAFALCSPSHIRKSILNLLINAVEATLPSGTVTIQTSNQIKNLDKWENRVEKTMIEITVTDQGPGIAPEQIDHIFEPFYTTKRMGRSGSGLGLSVVWNTVVEHKGEITVDNTPEGGRFSLQLETISNPAYEPLIDNNSTESIQGSGNILIVEDDPQLYEIALNTIERLGYTGTIASSGEEAISLVEENEFDLILLDMVLGEGLGGFETFGEITRIKPQQKAIIVSGYSTSDEVSATMELGASSVVKKPYSVGELGQAIKECLMDE